MEGCCGASNAIPALPDHEILSNSKWVNFAANPTVCMAFFYPNPCEPTFNDRAPFYAEHL
eukprot:2474564-Amphidinium_carterae.1